jgi:hypothetical protein
VTKSSTQAQKDLNILGGKDSSGFTPISTYVQKGVRTGEAEIGHSYETSPELPGFCFHPILESPNPYRQARPYTKLSVNIFQVKLNGFRANVNFFGDGFVGFTRNDQSKDFQFAGGEIRDACHFMSDFQRKNYWLTRIA